MIDRPPNRPPACGITGVFGRTSTRSAVAVKGFLLTMQYEEKVMLPIFLSHYARYFPKSGTYVLDHGSTENHVPEGVNRIWVPRDRPFSEQRRRAAVSYIVASLLQHYDW